MGTWIQIFYWLSAPVTWIQIRLLVICTSYLNKFSDWLSAPVTWIQILLLVICTSYLDSDIHWLSAPITWMQILLLVICTSYLDPNTLNGYLHQLPGSTYFDLLNAPVSCLGPDLVPDPMY